MRLIVRPEALTLACKKQNHYECFCFYPGVSERAQLSAYYAQPNIKKKEKLQKESEAVFCI